MGPIGGLPLSPRLTGAALGGGEGPELTSIFFNERKGSSEVRLPVEVLKFPTGGCSWKGIACGSIIAKPLAPRFFPSIFFNVAVIKTIWTSALKTQASGRQL